MKSDDSGDSKTRPLKSQKQRSSLVSAAASYSGCLGIKSRQGRFMTKRNDAQLKVDGCNKWSQDKVDCGFPLA